MITIIQCGAHLNSFSPSPSYSCLVTAVKENNTNMILLMISHEDKTIFTRERKPANATFTIDSAFYYKNIAVVEALMEKQLITPNYGLKKYTYWKKPSQEILQYLISKGATNLNEQLKKQVKINQTFTDSQIQIIQSVCEVGAYSEEGLQYLEENRKLLESVINLIKKNKPNETKSIDNK